ALELGVQDVAARRDAETLAFVQLLRAPKVALLRRRDDGGEALGPSPLLERLDLACASRGAHLPDAVDASMQLCITAAPVRRPLPSAAAMLPEQLSASACEALRACPYQFFTMRILRLQDADELDDDVEKRDYGTWLHDVLNRFHETREAPSTASVEEARLHAVARAVQLRFGLDDAAFLPFGATFARFAPRYVEWLHRRDLEGARWLQGEVEMETRPAAWDGIVMKGIIDRVDSLPRAGQSTATQLLDYKTGSAESLKDRMKQPLEDTQLAVYAAVKAGQPDHVGPIAAAYLPVDEREGIKPVEHPDVEATARRLMEGIGGELARIRAGAALPALGEGRACEFCKARGLCRRDQWAVDDPRSAAEVSE
ncbi:MAG: PD-(D/E)XK nuclease family protein, partial [Caldimonas sp.]